MNSLEETIKTTPRWLGIEVHRFNPTESKIVRLIGSLDYFTFNIVLSNVAGNLLTMTNTPRLQAAGFTPCANESVFVGARSGRTLQIDRLLGWI